MTLPKALPIACTLTPSDFQDRIAAINALAREALRGYERRDLELELRYEPDAAHGIRAIVAAEQQCCAFLHFSLQEEPSLIRLTITAPEAARAAADELFSQFTGQDPGRNSA